MALIDYPETLPKPLLAGNQMQGGATFLRSKFEYATRQRRTYCADYMVKYKFTCESKEQMLAFKDFYYQTLTNGVSVFNAAWLIEGDEEIKEFRFASVYSVVELYKDVWAITAEFQMITRVKELGIAKYLLLDLPLLGSLVPRKSANPATDVTFTRATTATYIDGNGVLQYAAIDEARFEADGFLVEGGSTNLLLDSSNQTTVNWTEIEATYTINATVAPDSSNTAIKLEETSNTNVHYSAQNKIVAAGNNTLSCFVKAGEITNFTLRAWSPEDGETINVTLDLITGIATSIIGSFKVEELSNGWYKFSATGIMTNIATWIYLVLETYIGYTGTAGDGLYIWGAQLEELPFASSYIPTVAAAVTRGADYMINAQAGNNAENTKNSTVLIDFDTLNQTLIQRLFTIQPTSGSQDAYFAQIANGVRGQHGSGGFGFNAISDNVSYRFGLVYSAETNILTSSVDGAQVDAGDAGTQTINDTANPIIFGALVGGGAQNLYGHIKNFKIYSKALTDTEIALA